MFSILSGLHTGRCYRVGNQRWRRYTFGLCYISSNLSSKFFSPKSVGFLREVEISSFTQESHSTFHWGAFCHQSLCWAYGNQENMDAGFSNQILRHSSPLLCCFGKLHPSPKYSLESKNTCMLTLCIQICLHPRCSHIPCNHNISSSSNELPLWHEVIKEIVKW